MTLAQSDFVVTGAGPALLESDQDHFILAIPKHSTIFEKKIHSDNNSVSSSQQFKTYLV